MKKLIDEAYYHSYHMHIQLPFFQRTKTTSVNLLYMLYTYSEACVAYVLQDGAYSAKLQHT